MPGILDFRELSRVAFRVETAVRLKDLRGFTKGYTLPVRDSSTARKFIGQVALSDIERDIEETYQAIRDSFAFKRRQLEASIDEGVGVIHTPLFDYSIRVMLDTKNSGMIRWCREIASFREPAIVRSAEFLKAFGSLFNTLVFEFTVPISIEDLVDRIEDENKPGVRVNCASDNSTCEITIQGFRDSIHIHQNCLKIEGHRTKSSASLLDLFLAFVDRFPRDRDLPALR